MRKKPKIKQRAMPVELTSTNVADLFLLAGLPNPLHMRVTKWLETRMGPSIKVIATAGQSYDGAIYKQRTVDALVESAAQFAIRQLRNRRDDQSARPRRIALFYVPAPDDEILLKSLEFVVFPVPLRRLAKFDDFGTQMRHRPDACESAIQDALEVYRRQLVGIIEQRIASRKSHEPLLLPPWNFHIKNKRMGHAFSELIRGTRAWEMGLVEFVKPEMFDRKRLPSFLDHNETQGIHKDTRGVVFPCCRPSEAHALSEFDQIASVEGLLNILRSTYRFGASLPPGFHHDAQLEEGVEFRSMPFDCSREGRIAVTTTHVNVYPNDFVRPG